MVNQQIADILNNMAAYLEMMEDDKNNVFRSRALKNAADTISKFPHSFDEPDWQDIEKLKKIEGIGQKIASHIIEYVQEGKITEYERMKKKSPIKLEELLQIHGVGPKTVIKLYKELKIKDLKSLEKAAKQGKIANLPGFGETAQKNILESIKFAIMNKDRISLASAEEEAHKLLLYLALDDNITKIQPVGSFRRRKETIGDIDLLAVSKNPKKTMAHFTSCPTVEKVLAHGDTKSSIWLKSKMQADIRIIDKDRFGAALQYFTGNKDHNIKLRNIAISKNYKLSEYGLFNRKTSALVEGTSEKKIYEILVSNYIEPELRENTGELDAAQSNSLPKLITLKDIQGDLHIHTTFSDGVSSIDELAIKGISMGYKYIGISDHLGKLKVAGALSEQDIDRYLHAIREADKNFKGIKILAGGEVDIDQEGNLEFNEDKLKKLDYVVGAVHLARKMPPDTMTKRLVTALKNPLVTILAHPTGKIIGHRPESKFDYEEVFKTAKNNNTALEINAHPMRLDLNDKLVKFAVQIGCKIVINTDAHSEGEMDYMKFGIDVARRGWLEKKHIYLHTF